jgi:UDP-glucose 4-epimerase
VRMKNILVTGGFGFIGSHLLELLIEDRDNQVHVVDNLSSSPLPLDFLLDELGHPENLTYDIQSLEEYCNNDGRHASFDEIYHLASVVGPAGVLSHAGRIVQSTVIDSYLLIDMALRNDAKLVDVSTSEVYGGGREGLCKEDFSKIVPAETTVRLEYAVGKLAAEIALINTTKISSLKCSIVRPFNIAGPRQSGQGGFVLPRFIAQAILKKPLTVFGQGKQLRAFTHVKDIAQGLILAMAGGENGEVYNLGNPQNKISIRELAEQVITISGSSSQIQFVDPKTIYGNLYAEANDKFPDAEKSIRELGWQPSYSVVRTIQDTIDYMHNLPPVLFSTLGGLSGIQRKNRVVLERASVGEASYVHRHGG